MPSRSSPGLTSSNFSIRTSLRVSFFVFTLRYCTPVFAVAFTHHGASKPTLSSLQTCLAILNRQSQRPKLTACLHPAPNPPESINSLRCPTSASPVSLFTICIARRHRNTTEIAGKRVSEYSRNGIETGSRNQMQAVNIGTAEASTVDTRALPEKYSLAPSDSAAQTYTTQATSIP